MGSFSDLTINNYTGFELKNSYYRDIVNLIFTKKDYLEYSSAEDGETRINKVLQSSAEICLLRLEIYGVNMKLAEKHFDSAISKEYSEGISIDRIISFDEYLEFVADGLNNYKSSDARSDDYPMGTIENSLLLGDFYVDGMPIEIWLYILLKSINKDAVIRYNLTEIINSGWITDNFYESIKNKKIIVLTEGKTDSKYLKEGLNILFPEISDYYHFMDFEIANSDGGASFLVHSVKSFIGSGINNLIIALFDNDTTGKKEITKLKKIKYLPENIKAVQYPNLKLATDYPTIGPTGMQNIDINGSACSIELYFGKDILIDNGILTPIQWKGYDNLVNQYQGEIQNKNKLQKKFEKKLKSKENIRGKDWSDLTSLIKTMIYAWQ